LTRPRSLGSARPPIGYVVLTFPLVSETFVENEIRVAGELGVDVVLTSMQRPEPGAAATTVLPSDRVTYRPSTRVRASSFLRWFARRPVASATNLWVALRERSETMVRACVDAAWVADVFRAAGVRQVHAHFATEATAVAMAAARLLGVPYTFTAHALDLYVRNRGLCTKAASAARVVTVCEYNVDQLQQACPHLDRSRVTLVYCGVDTDDFALREPPPPADELRVLSVGRLVPKKGFPDLIEAVALARARGVAVTLDVIGEGRVRPDLEQAIERHGLAGVVRLLGARANREVREALARTDVFALACVIDPDTGDRDSMPVVVKEAMAVGVPVLVTDEVGNPEMVDAAVGRIVPPNDPAALAQALVELAALTPDERRALGLAGRARVVERFDVRSETAKLVALFDQVAV
jgi:colanic acid/amylovoran biosynthesis glycosyltransferase